jgi:hypothetical protein
LPLTAQLPAPVPVPTTYAHAFLPPAVTIAKHAKLSARSPPVTAAQAAWFALVPTPEIPVHVAAPDCKRRRPLYPGAARMLL